MFKPFTTEEIQFIRDNYLTIPVKTMATMLNRSGYGVSNRMKKMELIVPPDIIEARKKASQFIKGQQPANKGLKQTEYMTPEAIAKTEKSRFQKNHIPHNTLEVGAEVQRKDKTGRMYWMIKVPENKRLIYKHTWLYEQHFGKIGKNQNIIFKNGNSLDCQIENLECISDAELMLRNTIQRFPAELVSQIKKVSKLKRTIKQLNHGKNNL